MWEIKSHRLEPLTNSMISGKRFKWTDMDHKVFEEIRWVLSRNTLLDYPYFKKQF